MGKQSRSFVVIGLGSFGSVVASELARFGNRVMGVDKDPRRVAALAETLPQSVILDATDEGALREAGIDRYDVGLVSIGNDLESNVIAAMNLRLIGVGTVWAKAESRTHHRILSKIGADRVVMPGLEMGRHTAQMLNNPAVQDYVSLGNGFSVVNLLIPQRLAGRHLKDLNIGKGIEVLGLMRGTEFCNLRLDDRPLQANDRLLLLGKRPDLTRFGDQL
ncbi:TrkA family potassium uptake protein [Paracoccus sp. 1_MG-2023]|uniref:potassium channel family protein n=1 Tax=unclassified Paracoccus (in: a-proteobacteria) TaxID=2688777 RepID=UPI001C0A407B|nr:MULTISPECIES: TrkA family potassium uptake protein [unclassified Paracoccus (in: a-proteobacteria)]MBU2958399.1 TrkA family potassium uptake protein [Paracoccus sp. C2R09]MDO6668616.1 TrkA family potassium uptake protein [Paracoccus sp. 1_MG-2023]